MATIIGAYAFARTGPADLTVILGSTPPMLWTDMFAGVVSPKSVTVMAPSGATGYGSAPTNTAVNNWGNAFRGKGWSGGTNYLAGTVNSMVNLTFDTY
jgi:hypothetical protein